jgi:hypothetical protein
MGRNWIRQLVQSPPPQPPFLALHLLLFLHRVLRPEVRPLERLLPLLRLLLLLAVPLRLRLLQLLQAAEVEVHSWYGSHSRRAPAADCSPIV